ncbi:hypothetical protein ATANTOWER_032970 [Ataeniobius toweri]|uniref:Uncharacterized protein n=1 Tax=Ataeniobius toweri TaxID=208326 RepID=A0ABU7B6M7_9TELE|nr:hypothetical protein [Ataeniobius toweri]
MERKPRQNLPFSSRPTSTATFEDIYINLKFQGFFPFSVDAMLLLTRLTGEHLAYDQNKTKQIKIDQESAPLWSLLCRSEVASTQLRTCKVVKIPQHGNV